MKKIKRMLAALAATTLALGVFALPVRAANASVAEANVLPDFSEDFEGYGVNSYIENTDTFNENWENNVLRGGEAQGMDSHLKGIAKVEYESGESGNKVLHIDNASVSQNTFFYIGPAGDYRVKNFTVGFKVKFLTAGVGTGDEARSWIGVSFRKKAEVHYTGTNNLMFNVTRYVNSAVITGQPYAIFNGGNTIDLSTESNQTLYGNKLTVKKAQATIANATANADTPWIDYRLEVNDKNYKIYVNDTAVIDCTLDIVSFDYFGYLSLNCCTANVLVDDFYVNNADTELPPVINPLATPVLTLDEENRKVSWSAVAGANLYGVYVNDELVKTAAKTNYTLDEDLEAGDYVIKVKAISSDTFEALDSAFSEPITYTVAESGSGGCGSVVGSVGAGLTLLAIGLGVTLRKKKD